MRKQAGAPDRWATLNLFTADDLARLTAETGSAAAGLCWYVLCVSANGKTGRVRASSRWLASKTGLSRNTVITGVRALVNAGFIKRDGSKGWFTVRHVAKA